MKKRYINCLLLLLIILVSIYIIRLLKLYGFCCMIISLLSPIFFGYIIYWILRPIVNKIKFNRVITTTIIYLLFLGIIVFILFNLVPLIISESKKVIPILKYYILNNRYISNIFKKINIKKILSLGMKNSNRFINNIFSIGVNVAYSLLFGFYFLIKKEYANYFKFIPTELKTNISKDLRLYIKSMLLDTLFMFTLLSIVFSIIGLSSPILFALFCAITNIIPYIGPYIGGIPAVLIGLTNSFKLGIIVTVSIMVVQSLENNIVQPMIVSKNVNINPIYILISVIIFSHFFGILGMIFATPITLIVRNIINYYKKNKPNNWFNSFLEKS